MRNALSGPVRHFFFALVLTFCLRPLQGATLERLSLDDMIAQSTAIVRGRVVGSSASFRGPVIYTTYKIQVAERFKGPNQSTLEVLIPGGTVNQVHQEVAGAQQLAAGEEYVLFLWTGNSGLTYIMGLTQGMFSLSKDGSSDPSAVRNASTELMLERATGQAVRDQRLIMRLSDLKARISGKVTTSNQGAVQ